MNAPHSDDIAVDLFAAAMKQKLAACRAVGYHGWESCEQHRLENLFDKEVANTCPDFVDIANFAMMLFIRSSQVHKYLHAEAAKPRRHTMHNPAFAAPYGNGVRPKTLDQLFTASGPTLDDVAAEATRRKPGESDAAFRNRIQRAVQAADYSKMAAHWDPATGKDCTVDTNKFFAEQYMVEPRTTRAQVIHQLLNNSTNTSREFLEELSDEELLSCASGRGRSPGTVDPWLLRVFKYQVTDKKD